MHGEEVQIIKEAYFLMHVQGWSKVVAIFFKHLAFKKFQLELHKILNLYSCSVVFHVTEILRLITE